MMYLFYLHIKPIQDVQRMGEQELSTYQSGFTQSHANLVSTLTREPSPGKYNLESRYTHISTTKHPPLRSLRPPASVFRGSLLPLRWWAAGGAWLGVARGRHPAVQTATAGDQLRPAAAGSWARRAHHGRPRGGQDGGRAGAGAGQLLRPASVR